MRKNSYDEFRLAMGLRIRRCREACALSQEELAVRLNYKDKSSISRIESGQSEIPLSKLFLLADILGTDVAFLMGWIAQPLSAEELELVALWRGASPVGKNRALGNLEVTQEDTAFAAG